MGFWWFGYEDESDDNGDEEVESDDDDNDEEKPGDEYDNNDYSNGDDDINYDSHGTAVDDTDDDDDVDDMTWMMMRWIKEYIWNFSYNSCGTEYFIIIDTFFH